ncbi:Dolichyl-diphosphooligosaccharide--protein glycosyltransferase subunit 1 [Halotydeus destructor]|nr:Dolichyl-diphosphooligosaccharide--protein glycosyltransferase subunit 1 [Halotydeus destructor]
MVAIRIALVLFALSSLASCQQATDVVNKKVDRVIDVSTQLVTVTCRIVVENNGKSPLNHYVVTFDENHKSHLANIDATIASDKKKTPLAVTKQVENDVESWKVDLGDHPIAAGASSSEITIEAVFTNLLAPFPEFIAQNERQLVLYTGNHYFASPYVTKTQNTKVKLPLGISAIERYSKLKPVSQSGDNINYGPYDNIAANSVSEMKVHYENNSPFLIVDNIDRSIEISHWAGLISVEEVLDVHHGGAKLKGSFSRYEFQREPTNGISAVKAFKTKLPKSAQDMYYRDEIGNISTSNVRKSSNNLLVELRPRFPLFGGWKTHYTFGYYLPTQEYLFNDGNQYILRIPFISHIYDNSVIDTATVRVVLPEGASNVKLRLPYSVTREKDELRKTYLDTLGRTVIVLKKTNLVEKHIQDFEVHYTYNRLYMLQEPLLLVAALFLLCVLIMISMRLDVSISSKSKSADKEHSTETAAPTKAQRKKNQ